MKSLRKSTLSTPPPMPLPPRSLFRPLRQTSPRSAMLSEPSLQPAAVDTPLPLTNSLPVWRALRPRSRPYRPVRTPWPRFSRRQRACSRRSRQMLSLRCVRFSLSKGKLESPPPPVNTYHHHHHPSPLLTRLPAACRDCSCPRGGSCSHHSICSCSPISPGAGACDCNRSRVFRGCCGSSCRPR